MKVTGLRGATLDTKTVRDIWLQFFCMLGFFLLYEAIGYYVHLVWKARMDSYRMHAKEITVVVDSPRKEEPEAVTDEETGKDEESALSLSPPAAEEESEEAGETPSAPLAAELELVDSSSAHSRDTTSNLLPRTVPALEGVRIIGALLVVGYHCFTIFITSSGDIDCNPCLLGNYWVHVFFVITGLVSYKSAARTDTPTGGLRLLERRAKAVYPLVYFSYAVFMISLLHKTEYYEDTYVTSPTVLLSLLMAQSWVIPFDLGAVLNASVWYVSNLALFWIAIPHWSYVAKRASGPVLALMVAVIYIAGWAPHVMYYDILGYNNFRPAATMGFWWFSPWSNWRHVAIGILLAAYLDRFTDPFRNFCERFGATLGSIALTLFFAFYKEDLSDPDVHVGFYELLWWGPFSTPVLALLFIGCSASKDPTTKFLTLLGKYFGRFAFPIYIMHLPASEFAVRYLSEWFDIEPGEGRYQALVIVPSIAAWTVVGSLLHERWVAFLRPKPRDKEKK